MARAAFDDGVGEHGRDSMAKGLYLMPNGQVLVEYGKRRRVPIPPAQYKANGYKPPWDELPAEAPRGIVTSSK